MTTTKSAGHSGSKQRPERHGAPARDAEVVSTLDAWSEKIESSLAAPRARAAMAVVVVLAAIAIGLVFGLELAVLSVAAVALLAVIWLMWLSLQSLSGETPIGLEEAMSLAAPSAEEERKRSVLRALKDLEYERSVGKISEQDYVELSNRYREEAKALMRALAEGNSEDRSRVESVFAERLAALGPATTPAAAPEDEPEADDGEEPEADDRPETKDERAAEPAPEDRPVDSSPVPAAAEPVPVAADVRPMPTRRCAKCSTRNDLDAGFCKRCGERMANADQVLCRACPRVYDRTEPACPDCGVRQEAE